MPPASGLIPVPYTCPVCGEENETFVDPGGGNRQHYTEDCAVCCRPNLLRIALFDDGTCTIEVDPEE